MKLTMASTKNDIATFQNIEIHMGQIAKELVEIQSGHFQPTPKPPQKSIAIM